MITEPTSLAPTDKIFVSNLNEEHDFSPAEKWGELIYITKGYTPLNDLEKLEAKIQKFVDMSSATDFVILSGANIICVLLSMLWYKKHGYINVLHYSKRSRRYEHYVMR